MLALLIIGAVIAAIITVILKVSEGGGVFGKVNPILVCPHCQTRGQVHARVDTHGGIGWSDRKCLACGSRWYAAT